MGLLDNFLASFRSKSGDNDRNILRTPHADLDLENKADRAKARKLVIELHRETDALTRHDVADWRQAWQRAINIDSPDRRRLYDIYRDTAADLHLTGCIQQRRGFVMSASFKIVNQEGVEDRDAMHYFDQGWFKQFLRLAHDANWYGHSLIRLGTVIEDGDGCPSYSSASLVPRKHVIPEYHRVVSNQGDDWKSGIDYHDPAYASSLIEVGEPDSLGIFLLAAPQTIAKKNALAFWDGFAEIFGMPMRIARTGTRDEKERRRLEAMLRDSGSSLSMVTGIDTEIEVVESGRGDAYNVYDRRVDRANSELSKLTIGQTMTIEDGSSLSQSETHLKVFQNLVESDKDSLRDTVNNKLIPRMIADGFPLEGRHFEWDYAVDYTPEQQVAYETMLLNNFEIDAAYFAEKYNVPVGERRSGALTPPAEEGTGGKPSQKECFFD